MRVESLGFWCQGFLSGLELAEVNLDEIQSNEELEEVIQDIAEIAEVNYDVLEDDEDDERAYAEIVEYVRVAVLMVYAELEFQQGHQEQEEPSRLH